jgi:diguanylate cyclase (GGDEF)-like protein
MQNEIQFDGFQDLIRAPLEKKDPRSFEAIKEAIAAAKQISPEPFRFLLQFFMGKKLKYREREARDHWRRMLRHKDTLEMKLGRRVGIHTAIFDYFDAVSPYPLSPVSSLIAPLLPEEDAREDSATQGSPTMNHLEMFKKEVFRAKRYKHSLSAIMLEVDDFQKISQSASFQPAEEVLSLIVKIITKTIRIVDILYRYLDHRFLIILPNTNQREAAELAERIQQNICERTKRIFGTSGITVTLSVGQTMCDSNSVEFIKRLEMILEEGKKKKCNAVYSM